MTPSNMYTRHKTWWRGIAIIVLVALADILTASQSSAQPSPAPVYKQDKEALSRQRVAATFHMDVLGQMELAINETIAAGSIPGGVLWIEHNSVDFVSAYGYRALVPQREMMTRDTIFDISSLTKVVATTPAVMKLVEQNKIKHSDTAQKFIPEFSGNGKEKITIRQLLTHSSGLRPDISTRPAWSGYDTAIKMASTEKVYQKPGTDFRYSDINFFILAEVVHRVSGQRIEAFVQKQIYQPLKMKDTGFLPPPSTYPRIAPTERHNGKMLRGTVHDPTAQYMGGVAGHAGIFSTIDDLARYCRILDQRFGKPSIGADQAVEILPVPIAELAFPCLVHGLRHAPFELFESRGQALA